MGAIRTTAAAVLMLIGMAASAADCVTGARLLSTRSSVPNLVAGPAAWSGTVLAVARMEENAEAIWVGIYSDNLDPLVADRRVATDASDSTSIIALLWNGSEFGLFYRTDTSIKLQRLTTLGEPIGAPVDVNPNRRPRLGDDIEVAWSDALEGWVVARHIGSGTSRGIWVTVLDDDGTERVDTKIPAAPPTDPQLALAVSDTGVIGLFHLTTDDANALLFTRLVPGQFPETHTIATAGVNVQATAVDDLFVVARRVGDDATAEIRWFIVDSTDQIVRPDGVLVAGNGGVLTPLALVDNDDELALTYAVPPSGAIVPDMHLRRFTVAGAILSDTPFAGVDVTASRALSTDPPVWTGTSYIASATRESGTRLDSYLVRYCPLRTAIEAPRVVLTGQPVTFTANTNGGVPEYSYDWSISRDPGGVRTGASIQRTFTLTGTRVVTLTVTDKNGAKVTSIFTVEVVDEIVVPTNPPKRRAVRK